jgi:hypothetical protein
MTPSEDSKRPKDVLSSLPRTRPQRPSARRAAAKRAAASGPARGAAADGGRAARPKPAAARGKVSRAAAGRSPGSAGRSTARAATNKPAGKTGPRRTPKAPPAPLEPAVPRQGFETEDEIAPGTPVQPPTRPELAASVAELLGELAQTGFVTGGRLLKDALARLPGV